MKTYNKKETDQYHTFQNVAYSIALLFTYRPTQKVVKGILTNDIEEKTEVHELNAQKLGNFFRDNTIDLLITNSLGLHESGATENKWYQKDGAHRLHINGREVDALIMNDPNYDMLLDYVLEMINKKQYIATSKQ